MDSSSVRLVRKLDVTDLCGEKVMIDFESGKYFMLKGIANDIWDMLGDNESIQISKIIQELLTRYEVEEELCNTSVREFLEKLNTMSMIEYC